MGGTLSTLGLGWQDVATWLVIVSSMLIAVKETMNWLAGIQDKSGEKARTAPLGALGALTATTGIGIFAVAVLTAL